jgi:plastocyanin
MSRGVNVTFNYEGFSPMSAEVSEAGFAPAETTVKAGAWVVWTNVGQDYHSVTATGAKPAFDSSPSPNKPLIPGATFAVRFEQVGDFTYFDRYGTGTGVVHVLPGPGVGPPA